TVVLSRSYFFFRAEDAIRYRNVTGVQTCALPIYIVRRAWRDREPSVIAKYALNLARTFNKYYANSKILVEDDQLNARLALVTAVSNVLTESLRLLGVKAPQEM